MPYVNIKVTREGTAPGATATTPEQKQALIKGVSDLLFEVMGKPPHTTFVVIDEVELDSWGVGGVTTPEWRERQRAAGTDATDETKQDAPAARRRPMATCGTMAREG